MRRAAKRDDNEALIVTALQSAGWTVVRVSDAGAPDLLVARNGVLTLVEVKGPKGTLTETQKVAFTRLATAGVLVQVVRSPQEALEALGAPWTTMTEGRRWYAASGAFLCESCWLPEDGLHAPKCPNRTRLKPKPAVQSAHRAERQRKAWEEEVIPKVIIEGEMTREQVQDVMKSVRPLLGVEGELQPLKVRIPPREVCVCGHPLSDHDTLGTGQCWFDTGPATGYCTCLTFTEPPPPAS